MCDWFYCGWVGRPCFLLLACVFVTSVSQSVAISNIPNPNTTNSFQPVLVGEPSVGATVSILRGLKERYESHHGIRITDGAIVLAAKVGRWMCGCVDA